MYNPYQNGDILGDPTTGKYYKIITYGKQVENSTTHHYIMECLETNFLFKIGAGRLLSTTSLTADCEKKRSDRNEDREKLRRRFSLEGIYGIRYDAHNRQGEPKWSVYLEEKQSWSESYRFKVLRDMDIDKIKPCVKVRKL